VETIRVEWRVGMRLVSSLKGEAAFVERSGTGRNWLELVYVSGCDPAAPEGAPTISLCNVGDWVDVYPIFRAPRRAACHPGLIRSRLDRSAHSAGQ
jgi:hypothetical protein